MQNGNYIFLNRSIEFEKAASNCSTSTQLNLEVMEISDSEDEKTVTAESDATVTFKAPNELLEDLIKERDYCEEFAQKLRIVFNMDKDNAARKLAFGLYNINL